MDKTKATHTPTPWSFELGTQPHTIAIFNDLEMKTIAVLHHDQIEDEANASYICKAVNAHEELLNACKVALAALTGDEKVCGVGMPVGQILKEAIAAAEGGNP